MHAVGEQGDGGVCGLACPQRGRAQTKGAFTCALCIGDHGKQTQSNENPSSAVLLECLGVFFLCIRATNSRRCCVRYTATIKNNIEIDGPCTNNRSTAASQFPFLLSLSTCRIVLQHENSYIAPVNLRRARRRGRRTPADAHFRFAHAVGPHPPPSPLPLCSALSRPAVPHSRGPFFFCLYICRLSLYSPSPKI